MSASRGEVVVHGCPEAGTCLKRAVAVGGDSVEAREGRLLVNGKAVEEDYLGPNTRTEDLGPNTRTEDLGPFDLVADEVFMLGDNRSNSQDSRHYGPVSLSTVSGVVVAVNMPLGWISWG